MIGVLVWWWYRGRLASMVESISDRMSMLEARLDWLQTRINPLDYCASCDSYGDHSINCPDGPEIR